MINISDKKQLVKYIWSFTLGDGWMVKPHTGGNASYGLSQAAIHKDYVDWQVSILENLTSVHYRYVDAFVDNRGVNNQAQIRITSKVHPFYTTLYERIYTPLKVKSISVHDLKLLDWETLAILYMDDGYIERTERKTTKNYIRIRIATENYSHADVLLLQKAIYEKTSIPFNLHKRKMKDTYGWRLETVGDKARYFVDNVSKYILPSFEYKLDTEKQSNDYPVTNSEDIV